MVEEDIDEILDLMYENRYISCCTELMQFVVDKIAQNGLEQDDIVNLLKDCDAEISYDILLDLLKINYLTKEQVNWIDKKLIQIYSEEFRQDLKSGALQSRLKFKTDRDKRLISLHEVLSIFYLKSLDFEVLSGRKESQDLEIDALSKIYRYLIKKSSKLHEKQIAGVESALNGLLDNLEEVKKEV